ncbi:neuroepithelial cell-transforming protein 1 protein-like [Solea senegalensis]|uniref:Neuroepithelial cell-transforming protein 1 protein-like n=1 Tax=Solea senegalensis TaxID=28829 RepID=A0AAV6T120_SOLSE|nr:neuroepithelial cell-transforming gene 1 protein-like [Solea senegalensis]KAG7523078.1 neuroepithelial cell-transforming protein 1 protein-like [Solea senegalensis]
MEENEEVCGRAVGKKKQKIRRVSSRTSICSTVSAAEPSPQTLKRNNSKKPPLQRGSSFTFLTPGTPWDFSLKRKRKEKDDDTVSLSSFDLKEPCNKRVRPLAKVSSLVNLISPSKNGAVRRFGQTFQTMSLRGDSKSPGTSLRAGSKAAGPTPSKRRNSTLWSETLDVHQKSTFSTKEIKRQEAIHELYRGEQDLIEDLQLARKAYHDPMLKLSIMTEEELSHIFGDLDAYIPLHDDLLIKLTEGTGPDGTVAQIGQIVINWLPGLNAYKNYCSNQLAAKALLDQKKQDSRVQDFLQRCLESPFSRKLDLWSFLDIPRSRLVKYPLLLREILRHTPPDHPDVVSLERAIVIIQEILSEINVRKGESECQYYIDKLEYLDEKQRDPLIDNCKILLCHGELRIKSGTRLHVFLFSELLVLTRPVTRNDRSCFQVYRQPIPVRDLALEDLQDGEIRMGGSFRGAFTNSEKVRNIFRVSSLDPSHGQSHTLQVNDVYHKQQWLNCLRAAMAQQQETPPKAQQEDTTRAKRRSSTSSDIICDKETDENCPPALGPKLRPQTLSKTRLDQKLQGPVKKRMETVV